MLSARAPPSVPWVCDFVLPNMFIFIYYMLCMLNFLIWFSLLSTILSLGACYDVENNVIWSCSDEWVEEWGNPGNMAPHHIACRLGKVSAPDTEEPVPLNKVVSILLHHLGTQWLPLNFHPSHLHTLSTPLTTHPRHTPHHTPHHLTTPSHPHHTLTTPSHPPTHPHPHPSHFPTSGSSCCHQSDTEEKLVPDITPQYLSQLSEILSSVSETGGDQQQLHYVLILLKVQ